MMMVVEATLEEQVSNIREVIKGFYTRIEDLEMRSTLGTQPEEKTQRERIVMTVVVNINKLGEERANLCEESVQIWINLMEDP
jgi:hypothetical protein